MIRLKFVTSKATEAVVTVTFIDNATCMKYLPELKEASLQFFTSFNCRSSGESTITKYFKQGTIRAEELEEQDTSLDGTWMGDL